LITTIFFLQSNKFVVISAPAGKICIILQFLFKTQ
jgi:hypothetical protein